PFARGSCVRKRRPHPGHGLPLHGYAAWRLPFAQPGQHGSRGRLALRQLLERKSPDAISRGGCRRGLRWLRSGGSKCRPGNCQPSGNKQGSARRGCEGEQPAAKKIARQKVSAEQHQPDSHHEPGQAQPAASTEQADSHQRRRVKEQETGGSAEGGAADMGGSGGKRDPDGAAQAAEEDEDSVGAVACAGDHQSSLCSDGWVSVEGGLASSTFSWPARTRKLQQAPSAISRAVSTKTARTPKCPPTKPPSSGPAT